MNLPGLIRLAVETAAGQHVEIGQVAAATLETIIRIVDRPARDAAGEPITPEALEAKILAALAAARTPFEDVVAAADAELEKLDPPK